jgi:uncharacterized membrane protein
VTTRISTLLDRLGSSYWFLPSVMTLAAIVLAQFTLWIDTTVSSGALDAIPLLGSRVQADGARTLLGSVAGSLITVTGLVFSLTMVALPMAAQQFGPRLVGNFMRDRGNQTVLGVFLATYVYCLTVLRSIRSPDLPSPDELAAGAAADPGFVPQISLAAAFVLTLASLFVLIYFIHHMAESIQVGNVMARVSRVLAARVASYPPVEEDEDVRQDGQGEAADDRERELDGFDVDVITLRSEHTGYLQAIDGGNLARLAREHGASIRLHHRPGAYVMRGGALADVRPEAVADAVRDRLGSNLVFGRGRTYQQDPSFLFDQLLEVALRALSPGINDPFTAIDAVGRLAEGLDLLARREPPPSRWHDEDGVLRVVAPEFDLAGAAERVFGAIRGYGAGDLQVAKHLASTLRRLEASTGHDGLRRAAAREVRRLVASAEPRLSSQDLAQLREASKRVTEWIRLEEADPEA